MMTKWSFLYELSLQGSYVLQQIENKAKESLRMIQSVDYDYDILCFAGNKISTYPFNIFLWIKGCSCIWNAHNTSSHPKHVWVRPLNTGIMGCIIFYLKIILRWRWLWYMEISVRWVTGDLGGPQSPLCLSHNYFDSNTPFRSSNPNVI